MEKLCKFLKVQDAGVNLGVTRLSNDSLLGGDAGRQSVNVSDIPEIRRSSISQVVESNSVFARKASSSMERDRELLEKENLLPNFEHKHNMAHTMSNGGVGQRRLSGTFGGFTTLDEKTKSDRVMSSLNHNIGFSHTSLSNNIENR